MPKKKKDKAPSAVDLTATQQEAINTTLDELVILTVAIGAATAEATKSKAKAEDAKKKVAGLQAERAGLFARLIEIKAGRWQEKLFAGGGDDVAPVAARWTAVIPEEIPAALWNTALEYLDNSRQKGKGMSPGGLSAKLFGDRKKDHKERAENILAVMQTAGQVERSETDKKEPVYWPADVKK